MIPFALIVSPAAADADPIHATRVFNLIEFLTSIGWHGDVFDDGFERAIDRLILIEREGHDADRIRAERLSHPHYGTRLGFAEVRLDWTDIDAFDGSTDAARMSDPAGAGVDRAELGSRIMGAGSTEDAATDSPTSPNADTVVLTGPVATRTAPAPAPDTRPGPPPLIAFAGDHRPRELVDTVAFPDGTLLATLDAAGLSFRRQDGERPRPTLPSWTTGLTAPLRLLAATRELGHVVRLLISSPEGTFSVRSPDQREWLRPERIGEPFAAAAFAGDVPVVIDAEGRLATAQHAAPDAESLPAIIAGVDVVTRGATVWLLVWGTDRAGERVAVLHRRSGRTEWVETARQDDVVRSGLERRSIGDPAIWAIGSSGESRRVAGGTA